MLRPVPEGGFTVVVPALPGCVTYGRTLAEAKTIVDVLLELHNGKTNLDRILVIQQPGNKWYAPPSALGVSSP